MKSTKTKLLLGILVSSLFVYLAFRKIHVEEMLHAFGQLNCWYLLPALLFVFLSLWIRAVRWGYFLRPIKRVNLKALFSSLMIGYMANNIFPAHLGELLRAYSVGRTARVSSVSALASIIVERILDVLTLLLIFAITVLFQPFPDYVQQSSYVIFGITMGGIIFLSALVYRTEATLKFVLFCSRPLPQKLSDRLQKFSRSLLEGFLSLKQPRHYPVIVLTSILIWSCYIATVQCTIFAFGFHHNQNLPWVASIVILVMVGFSVAIPSSPGYIGTYHYFCMVGLSLYGIEASSAFSFAIVLHLLNFIPLTVAGLYYFWQEHFTIREAFSR
ncbi:UPF0104 family protein [candidate division KSB1 bacterium]|nr:MAG: UPF0104 family protein [candidate division KSB1 bacterium]